MHVLSSTLHNIHPVDWLEPSFRWPLVQISMNSDEVSTHVCPDVKLTRDDVILSLTQLTSDEKARQLMTRLHGYPSERDFRRMSGELCDSNNAIRTRHQKFLRAADFPIESFDADENWRQQRLDSPKIPVNPTEGTACQRPETQQQKNSNVRIRRNGKASIQQAPTFVRLADIQTKSRRMRQKSEKAKRTQFQ